MVYKPFRLKGVNTDSREKPNTSEYPNIQIKSRLKNKDKIMQPGTPFPARREGLGMGQWDKIPDTPPVSVTPALGGSR